MQDFEASAAARHCVVQKRPTARSVLLPLHNAVSLKHHVFKAVLSLREPAARLTYFGKEKRYNAAKPELVLPAR